MVAKVAENVGIHVGYGIGANCQAVLPRERVCGVSARDLVRQVADAPQITPEATRTADVLRGVINGSRMLDAEVLDRPGDDVGAGKPVKLDSPVLEPADGSETEEEVREITLRISEPYRGGDRL